MYLKCRFISGTENMYNKALRLTPEKTSQLTVVICCGKFGIFGVSRQSLCRVVSGRQTDEAFVTCSPAFILCLSVCAAAKHSGIVELCLLL